MTMKIPLVNRLFGKTNTIICPDGSPRVVYKDIDDIYPLLSKDHMKNLELAVNAASQLVSRQLSSVG